MEDVSEVEKLCKELCDGSTIVREAALIKLYLKNDDGRTPLHLAAEMNRTDLTITMLCYGAVYDAIDSYGKHPCDYAPEESEVFKFYADFHRDSQLILVTKKTHNHFKQIKARLQTYSPEKVLSIVNGKDVLGKTLLDNAMGRGNSDAVCLIMELLVVGKKPIYTIESIEMPTVALLRDIKKKFMQLKKQYKELYEEVEDEIEGETLVVSKISLILEAGLALLRVLGDNLWTNIAKRAILALSTNATSRWQSRLYNNLSEYSKTTKQLVQATVIWPITAMIREIMNWLLFESARSNDTHSFQKLLDACHDIVDVNAKDPSGLGALQYAVQHRNEPILDALLDSPSMNLSANLPADKFYLLGAVVRGGHVPALRELLEVLTSSSDGRAMLDRPDDRGRAAVLEAADRGSLEMLELLTTAGARLWQRDTSGQSVAHIAVTRNDPAMLRFALERLPKSDVDDDNNAAALIDSRRRGDGASALHLACAVGALDAARLLLRHGASYNVPSEDGSDRTPAQLGAEHEDVVRLLAELDRLFGMASVGDAKLLRVFEAMSAEDRCVFGRAREWIAKTDITEVMWKRGKARMGHVLYCIVYSKGVARESTEF